MRRSQQISGITPTQEDCAQLGRPNYDKLAHIEMTTYMQQLNRIFKKRPLGLYFGVAKVNHEFGVYIDIVIHYDDLREDHVKALNRILENLPEVWDSKSLERLKSFSDYNLNSEPTEEKMTLRKAIDLIEESGGFVMFEDDSDMLELMAEVNEEGEVLPSQKHETKISAEEALSNFGIDETLIASLVMDSVVPACCKYGCEVEPDGTCEHGNPSALLEMGLI